MIGSLIQISCFALGWGIVLWIIASLVEALLNNRTISFLISILAAIFIGCGLAGIILFISAGIVISTIACFI
jgi:hypothetical protein